MRVLKATGVYFPELKFGGPPLKIHALAQGLRQHGHEVSVLTFFSEDSARSASTHYDGVHVQYLPWRGSGLRQWPTDRRLITQAVAAADVVHIYGLYNSLTPLAARAAAQAGKPCVLEPLGGYLPRGRNLWAKRLYHHAFTHRIARQAQFVIATSPQEFKELEPLGQPPKLVLRRNGIDVESFANLPDADIFRRKLGIPADRRVVLFLGRLSPVKNLEQFLEAFARVRPADTTLALVGPAEPDYETRLRAVAQRLGITGDIAFAGALYDEEKLSALAAADLFVMPSLIESYGNAVAEAVAAGLPVLLTDTCGIAPAIHERAGLAVPLGVETLANGLRTMLDPVERARLTSRRNEVMSQLSWAEPLRQMDEIYRSLVGNRH
ncbi:MAG: glycosyltransferase [Verrucomicrobia bacterium]|nr:glycosyltransferase [Verrucomicrobiota bacterium]